MENRKDKVVAIAGVFVIVIAIIAIIANANPSEEKGEKKVVVKEEVERPEICIYNKSYDDEVYAPTAGQPILGGIDHKDYPFDVGKNATHINITLDGDEGVTGQNDLDMELFGAREGRKRTSAGSGPDEHIELFQKDIFGMGYGEYKVRVKHFAGEGPIRYNLLIEIFSNITSENETNSTQEKVSNESSQKFFKINLCIFLLTRDAIFCQY